MDRVAVEAMLEGGEGAAKVAGQHATPPSRGAPPALRQDRGEESNGHPTKQWRAAGAQMARDEDASGFGAVAGKGSSPAASGGER